MPQNFLILIVLIWIYGIGIWYLGQFFPHQQHTEWARPGIGGGGGSGKVPGRCKEYSASGAGSGSGYYHAHLFFLRLAWPAWPKMHWMLAGCFITPGFLTFSCKECVAAGSWWCHALSLIQTLDFRFKRIYNSTAIDENHVGFQCREDLLVNSKGLWCRYWKLELKVIGFLRLDQMRWGDSGRCDGPFGTSLSDDQEKRFLAWGWCIFWNSVANLILERRVLARSSIFLLLQICRMNIQKLWGPPYVETSPELLQGMQGQTSPFLGMDPLGDLKAKRSKRFQAVNIFCRSFLFLLFQILRSQQYLYLQKL